MEYRNFGAAGLKISPLALGLGLRGQDDEAHAARMIERALDLGINLIDCANVYGPNDDRANIGRSEVVLGQVLQGRRDRVVITSKGASPIGPGPNDWGTSRLHLTRAVEESLQRLNTDYIDVYLVHIYDETTPVDETARALDDLVRSGKVRYIGCCNYAAWQVCHALWVADTLAATPFMCVQNRYSLLNRNIERELFGLVRNQRLGLMAYSPLAVGLLSGIYSPDASPPPGSFWASRPDEYQNAMAGQPGHILATVLRWARELGKTPAQLALAWVLSHDEVSVAITGGDTIAHLEDNAGAVGWTLDADARRELDRVSTIENTTVY